ncbi:hypothetical protein [Chloroflexus sp.]|uniref:hypothetical protein n=1 Tax=Chloroflexus sp. TaxID=1904827 RepID=UPI002ACE76FB|nr:hypothetical protein [Chloroflexus sp.]
MTSHSPIIVNPRDDEPLAAAVARGLSNPVVDHSQLAVLSELLARDAYLAEQVNALRALWAMTPLADSPPVRLHRRLAWGLAGPELARIYETLATLTRIVESLIAHLDTERAARQALAERLAALEE